MYTQTDRLEKEMAEDKNLKTKQKMSILKLNIFYKQLLKTKIVIYFEIDKLDNSESE